jgi:hypothetical protein
LTFVFRYVSGAYNTTVNSPTFIFSPREEDANYPERSLRKTDSTPEKYEDINKSKRRPPEMNNEVYWAYHTHLNHTINWPRQRVLRNVHLGGFERIGEYVETMLDYFKRMG